MTSCTGSLGRLCRGRYLLPAGAPWTGGEMTGGTCWCRQVRCGRLSRNDDELKTREKVVEGRDLLSGTCCIARAVRYTGNPHGMNTVSVFISDLHPETCTSPTGTKRNDKRWNIALTSGITVTLLSYYWNRYISDNSVNAAASDVLACMRQAISNHGIDYSSLLSSAGNALTHWILGDSNEILDRQYPSWSK